MYRQSGFLLRATIMSGFVAACLVLTNSVGSGMSATVGIPSVATRAPGRVVLRNTLWDSVRVEVRVGSQLECMDNQQLAMRRIPLNRSWAIQSIEPICWRREAQPGSQVDEWLDWSRAAVSEGQVVNVVLE